MTLVMMTALSVTRETERGTMESLLATPVEPLEVMAGKLAPYVVIGLVQTAIILVLARFLFGVPMEGGWAGPLRGRRPLHRRLAGAGLPDLDRCALASCRPCR